MSTREERILDALRTRMAAISGIVSAAVAPVDEFGDSVADASQFPCITVQPEETQPTGEREQQHVVVRMPVTLRALTQADPPAPGEGDVPATSLTAGYVLLRAMLMAVFPDPGRATGRYKNTLDGLARDVIYAGHAVLERDDGGKTSAAYLDVEVEYVLHLNNPDL